MGGAMAWIRRGTISSVVGSKRITGENTNWKSHHVQAKPGHIMFIQLAVGCEAVEIGSIISDTELDLVEAWRGEPLVNSKYGIETALIDSPSEYAQRIAAMFAYYQENLDTLDLLMSGDGDVTLTKPDGTKITVPSLASALHSVATQTATAKAGEAVSAAQTATDKAAIAVSAASKAEGHETVSSAAAATATEKATIATSAAQVATDKSTIAVNAATSALDSKTRAEAAAERAEDLVDQATGGSLLKEQNLADVLDKASARANLNVPSIPDLQQAVRNVTLESLGAAPNSAVMEYTNGKLTTMTEQLPGGTKVTTYQFTGDTLSSSVESFSGKLRTTTYQYDYSGNLTGFITTEGVA